MQDIPIKNYFDCFRFRFFTQLLHLYAIKISLLNMFLLLWNVNMIKIKLKVTDKKSYDYPQIINNKIMIVYEAIQIVIGK